MQHSKGDSGDSVRMQTNKGLYLNTNPWGWLYALPSCVVCYLK